MKSVKKYTSAKVAEGAAEEGVGAKAEGADPAEEEEDRLSSFVSVIMGNQHQPVDPSHIWGGGSGTSTTTSTSTNDDPLSLCSPPSE
jgi:hypothetical protein